MTSHHFSMGWGLRGEIPTGTREDSQPRNSALDVLDYGYEI